jgi:hypothetical protein
MNLTMIQLLVILFGVIFFIHGLAAVPAAFDPSRQLTVQSLSITTVAGTGTAGSSGNGGAATSALLSTPHWVGVDSSGNLYIADTANYKVRLVTTNGIISAYAGTGTGGSSGDNGPATSAQVTFLGGGYGGGMAVDASGNVFISMWSGNRVRVIAKSTGIITNYAGTGSAGGAGDGGQATSAQLSHPMGLAVDVSGNVYMVQNQAQTVRRVRRSTGIISTIAGSGGYGFSGNGGAATSATMRSPERVAVDISGNVYITDAENCRIRLVNAGTGIITTFVGTGANGFTGDGGPVSLAQVGCMGQIAPDSTGTFIYFVDNCRNTVRVRVNEQWHHFSLHSRKQ